MSLFVDDVDDFDDQRQQEDFYYLSGFLPAAQADVLLEQFWNELDWGQQQLFLYGRYVNQPRLSCWYGDEDADYTYSKLHLRPLPWHPGLLKLKRALEKRLRKPFNSVLANAYRDGQDSMAWHSDNEKELGDQPCIASISLGASRRFLLKNVLQAGAKTLSIELEHGSLLVMQNRSQLRYQHSVPKLKTTTGLRINLTFRQVFNGNAVNSNASDG